MRITDFSKLKVGDVIYIASSDIHINTENYKYTYKATISDIYSKDALGAYYDDGATIYQPALDPLSKVYDNEAEAKAKAKALCLSNLEKKVMLYNNEFNENLILKENELSSINRPF